MSFSECIDNATRDGDITPSQAVYVRDLFDAIRIDMERSMSPAEAEAAAARAAFDRMKADVAHSKRVKVLQAMAFDARKTDLAKYPTSGGTARPGKALQALVEADNYSSFSSLAYYQRSVERDLFSRMDKILYAYRKTVTGGARGAASQLDLVREVFGEDSGNVAARELATAWIEVNNYARLRANAAGMRIANRKDYGLPQIHNATEIRAVSKDEWINYTADRLDMTKMIDGRHGLPFTDQTLRAALSETYDSIVTQGLNNLLPGTAPRGRALHNKHTDHRFLVFESPAAWLEYQERFGAPDPFETMVDHMRSMARDIAQLEMLGPNPNATILALKADARKQVLTSGDQRAIDKVDGDLRGFDAMWNTFSKGDATRNTFWATVMSGTRNLLSSALLGGAPVTAMSDFNTQRLAAQFLDMPVTPLLAKVFTQMRQDPEAAKFAARMGLVADAWIQVGSMNARFFGDMMQTGITRRIADATHRLSGLTGLTRAGRQAFGLELQGWLADNVGKSFDALPGGLRDSLIRNGISGDEWELIRATPLLNYKGATFLRVLDIADRQDLTSFQRRDLSMKMMQLVEREMDQAVPQANIRAKTTMVGGTERGSLVGELARTTSMFKSFPLTIVMQNLGRFLAEDGVGNKARWLADFTISMTVVGAIIVEAKQMIYGRDPRDITQPGFWVGALLQGGGLGIFGDFAFSNINRYGGGFGSTLAGPAAGLGTDTINLTLGNLLQVVEGKKTNFGRELVDYVARYTPGTSIWYMRLAYERLVIDTLRKAADPDAERRFRAKQRRMEKDYGQRMWWEPGETAPGRAPDLSTALGR